MNLRALLVIHTNSYFANLFPVAQLLAASSSYEPVFLFASWYPTFERDQARCRDAGIAYVDRVVSPPVGAPRGARAAWALFRETAPYWIGRLHATMRSVSDLIDQRAIALMILPADNRYDLAAYVEAAHRQRIPVVAIPAFMAATTEWAQFVHGDPAHGLTSVTNRVAAALYPQWTHVHDGTTLLALPGGEILARQWLGLAPPLPWTLHSGHVDAMALESDALRAYCISERLPGEQLVVTGSVDHDRMHDRLKKAGPLREALYATLGLPPKRPMLLTALPPDQLYGRGRKDCELTDYDALVRLWIQALVATNYNVVVSLHPSVKRETMAWIEALGAKITSESTSAVIPLCDLYVASVSATIQWAIACGIPVINYDIYRFRYPDYVDVGGVINLDDQVAFRGTLVRFTTDASFRDELRVKQAAGSAHWGVLDGKAGTRLIALFDRLSASRANGSRSSAS